ncbi:DUF429 domain-containing protein [Candidatus Bathyarchaeota archaeon]|nr:MAG: DUF429 domain-containing protein [Candidatus Bathyarchaeota archaeon]
MSGLTENIIIGIDLAGTETNPTGWAMWKNKVISTCHLHENKQILDCSLTLKPTLIAIDAPLSLPTKGAMRKADKEMRKHGYPVLPPRFPAMKKLTLRAIEITKKIIKEGFDIIEVHLASTRKALKMPTKDWQKIQQIFISMGLEAYLKTRTLTPHETDAVTAVLTAHLYLKGKTELIGDDKEGYIVIPIKSGWRTLQL